MVPLPRHLVPEALGGTAKDELDVAEGAGMELFKQQRNETKKRNMLAPLKKLYRKEDFQKDLEKQV